MPPTADATCPVGSYTSCSPDPLVRADDNRITLTDYAVASDPATFLVCPSAAPYLCGIVFLHQTPTPLRGIWGIRLSCCVNAGDGAPTTLLLKGTQTLMFSSSFGASAGQTVIAFQFMPGYAFQGTGTFGFFYIFNSQGDEGGIGYQECPFGSTLGGFQFQSSQPSAIPLVLDNVYGICRRACTMLCTTCMAGTYARTAGATACSPQCAPGLYVNMASGACTRPDQCDAGYGYAPGYASADPSKTPTSNNALVCPLAAPFPCSASVYNAYAGYALGCCASLGATQALLTVTSGAVSGAPIASVSFVAGSLSRWSSGPSFITGADAGGAPLFTVGLATSTSSFVCPLHALPAGRWTDAATNTDVAVCVVFCQPCTAGSVYDGIAASAACASCAQGSYAATTGLSVCTACPSLSYASSSGMSACTSCAAGAAYVDAVTPCTPCTSGSASWRVPGVCTQCPTGTFSSAGGASACSGCPAGYYALVGSTVCSPCPIGTRAANGLCTTCSAGTYAPAAASVACTGCGAGTFAPSPGLSTCFACPPGYVQTGVAQTACAACAIGTAGSNPTAPCGDCPQGTYAGTLGASACLACAPGTYTGSTRSSTCTACAAGYMGPSRALTACAACAAGSFAGAGGLSACALCAGGTFSGGTGASACAPACAGGSFATGVGLTAAACQPCGAGTFAAAAGTSACALCPVGAAFGGAGQSACASGAGGCPLAPCPVDMFCGAN